MKKYAILPLVATLLAACTATPPQGNAPQATATGGGVKPYPLKTCVVTDTGLYSMGTPVTRTYGNQQIKFCCRPCVAKYEENPARYNAKL